MKKNRMMRLASGLLVAVLATTSMISGTYAKYTTQDSGSDIARVAKWGVELQVVGDLYGEKYLKATDNKATAGDTDLTVKSISSGQNIVAPGTKNTGNGFSFFLKGQPEVESSVKVDVFAQNIYLAGGDYGTLVVVPATVVTEANFEELKNELYVAAGSGYVKADSFANVTYYTVEDVVTTPDYYPVVYTLNGATNNAGSISTDSLSAAAVKILTAANAGDTATLAESTHKTLYTGSITKTYDENTNLSELNLNNTNLTWEWAFGDENKVGEGADVTDKADTILGNLIADTASDTYKVVKLNADEETYEAVSVVPVDVPDDAGYKDYQVAKVGDTIVACLTTQFGIDITVTQVD